MVLKKLENSTPPPYQPAPDETATVELHPIPSGEGLIVKVKPPREPLIPVDHIPCDIVLVIDVSGSMTADAPVPSKPGDEPERTGLSVLDLTKHAARTIMETLNEGDRLGIVTFASASCVLQRLLPMTEDNKSETNMKIESMKPKDATNLWHGIRDGLKLFTDFDPDAPRERVPALMVLTDGCPNHMCPTQGYVPKLRSMGKLPATIHTFGFGYSLRSGLLKSIAEIGGGNYSFIPDAGMVGTTFIHTVANLQSTFAQDAVLRLTYTSHLGLRETTGETVDRRLPTELEGHPSGIPQSDMVLVIGLNNIQYGQSRDIYLAYNFPLSLSSQARLSTSSIISATLTYQRLLQPAPSTTTTSLTFTPNIPSTSLSPSEIAYHSSRSRLISFLLSLAPPSPADDERIPMIPLPDDVPSKLTRLIATLPANNPAYLLPAGPHASAHCQSLLSDLIGPDPAGQISLALTKPEYYARWGAHYLLSLAGAHASQTCNSFKDAGPGMYGANSPLFVRCRERLDTAFDDLPAPIPSNLSFGGGEWIPAYNVPGQSSAGGRVGSFGGLNLAGWGRDDEDEESTTAWSGTHTPTTEGEAGRSFLASFSMRSYNSRDNPCFAGCVWVRLAAEYGGADDDSALAVNQEEEEEEESCRGKRFLTPPEPKSFDLDDLLPGDLGQSRGKNMIRIARLRSGMSVHTPRGRRKVVAVLKTAVKRQDMCLVGQGLLVTPWHPVALPESGSPEAKRWIFPKDVSKRKVRYTGSIYSVLLERDGDPEAHAVMVGGVWGVTLGHGLVGKGEGEDGGERGKSSVGDDVRVHPFFGSYDLVVKGLARLHRNRSGLVLGGGVRRNRETDLVDGFRRASLERVVNVSAGNFRDGVCAAGVKREAVCVALSSGISGR